MGSGTTMPAAMLPTDAAAKPWYDQDALSALRLASSNFWDVPINVGGKVVHVLVNRPTSPAPDGPEHRAGRRALDPFRDVD